MLYVLYVYILYYNVYHITSIALYITHIIGLYTLINKYIYICIMYMYMIMRIPASTQPVFLGQVQLQQELDGEKQLHSQTRGQLEESQLQIQAPTPEKWRVDDNPRSIPSGYLTVCHGKSLINGGINGTTTYKWAIFHGYVK